MRSGERYAALAGARDARRNAQLLEQFLEFFLNPSPQIAQDAALLARFRRVRRLRICILKLLAGQRRIAEQLLPNLLNANFVEERVDLIATKQHSHVRRRLLYRRFRFFVVVIVILRNCSIVSIRIDDCRLCAGLVRRRFYDSENAEDQNGNEVEFHR